MTSMENRIRWSGLLIAVGLIVVLLSLVWSSPLSFMAFLVLGCPLILAGVLLFLWALAGKDSSGLTPVVLMVVMLLPLAVSGCGGNDAMTTRPGSGESAAFDPSSATVRVFGKLILDGKPPEGASLRIGRDPFCQKNAQAIFNKGTLLAEGGGLRNVIVYVRSGHEGRLYAVPAEPVVLDQQQCVYVPHVLTLMKGQKLRILNSDPTLHNVHARTAQQTAFNNAQPKKGAEDIQTFSTTAMPFRIGCDFHDWMIAYAGVFEHPFHTTSGDTGTYELRLPPGKFEIVAWHEKFGEQAASIEGAPNAMVELDFKFPAIGK
jgi:plastocyanin